MTKKIPDWVYLNDTQVVDDYWLVVWSIAFIFPFNIWDNYSHRVETTNQIMIFIGFTCGVGSNSLGFRVGGDEFYRSTASDQLRTWVSEI
jgi:hypothetical protein